MLVADAYLGNVERDRDLAERVERESVVRVTVGDDERRRSRFRTTSDDGRDVGVVVGRTLDAGDVLDADGTPVVVDLAAVEAMVVPVGSLAPPAAVQLGHAVGNRHWTIAVRGDDLLVRATDARDRMEAEVTPFLTRDATVRYESVSPGRFDDAPAPHDHGSDAGDPHRHGGADAQAHSHGDHQHDGDEHSHGDRDHGTRATDRPENGNGGVDG
ncbi:urease accessory protein UreE [Haloarculaceae archaeon H-GB2-1]|nr:urease accessory protein UreE [Haloarculaceae archaeon H-GB1-1]MEA5406705.1 urease accessory protein UreE [Haloarculaceae archaeon H-GB2-1]